MGMENKETNFTYRGERGRQHRLLDLFFDLPIFYKILIGNLFVGAVAAILLLKSQNGQWFLKNGTPSAILVFGGILILAVGINYILLRIALSPISSLRDTVEDVLSGNFHARATLPLFGDPGVNLLTLAFNKMLDKIEVYTHTIEKERANSSKIAGLILSSQEDERKRIAKELHDDTSQVLTTLMMGLETVHKNIPKNGSSITEQCVKCRNRVERLMHIADQTIAEVHRLAFNLRPAILDDIGLVQAVQWLLREHLEKGGLQVELSVNGLEKRLRPELEVGIFRIIQEAVINILKYAQATKVNVLIAADAGELNVTVEDNGVGFSPDEVSKQEKDKRLGLLGMQERAYLLSGRLEVKSAPGAGVRVFAVFPMNTGMLEGVS